MKYLQENKLTTTQEVSKMIEKYTVRAFEKMEHHPCEIMDLVDEDYFSTIDKCKEWCEIQFHIKGLNFQIHHSVGAKNYLYGIASGMGIITWLTKDHDQKDIPTVECWWSIFDVPSEVDSMC
jgi:hypothetical protein